MEKLAAARGRQYVLVGGKGGVGKTSTSSSMGLALAQSNHNTLIVSTDPAHSLSDSLAVDVSGGRPVRVAGVDDPLWAMEVDAAAAKARFQDAIKAAGETGSALRKTLSNLGLSGLADALDDLDVGALLETPPPGFDEFLAIAEVIKLLEDKDKGPGGDVPEFTRVIFDTAPTGHTLRLLTLPDFLDGTIGKVLQLRARLDGLTGLVGGLFQSEEDRAKANARKEALGTAVERLEDVKRQLQRVQALFKDPSSAQFVVVAIPTELAISESARLVKALGVQGVRVSALVVNQVVGDGRGDDALAKFVAAKRRDQSRALSLVAEDATLRTLRTQLASLTDREVRGLGGLDYFGRAVWEAPTPRDLAAGVASHAEADDGGQPLVESLVPGRRAGGGKHGGAKRFVFVGGKGGVGKTSVSSSLALRLSDRGETVLVVSTDPAHSLSDALDQDVGGGKPVLVQGTPGVLWGLEVDAERELEDLKRRWRGAADASAAKGENPLGLPGPVWDALKGLNLQTLLDTPPPGLDEMAALFKVIAFTESDEYDRFDTVVFDTAPTGHTLRLLNLPAFVLAALARVRRLRKRIEQAGGVVQTLFGLVDAEKSAEVIDRLDEIERQVKAVDALLVDGERCEFAVVSVPTAMSVLESARLAKSLREKGVRVNAHVVNQVLGMGVDDEAYAEVSAAFLRRKQQEQSAMLAKAEALATSESLDVIIGPWLDLEVRGVPAIMYFRTQVWG